jgi:sigma-E factor negative regulatory protein RseC
MIEQQGIVVALDGSSARVRLGGRSGCSVCDSGRGCGAGVFGRMLRRRPVELTLGNRLGVSPGQPVMLGLSESVYLALVARLYLLPLLAGLAGAVLGHHVSNLAALEAAAADLVTLLGAVAFAVAALRWSRNWSRNVGKELNAEGVVHLIRVVERIDERKDREVVQ